MYYSGDLTNEVYIDNIFKFENGNKEIPNLDNSMFWNDTKKYYEQNYSELTIGVFNVIHFQFNDNKQNFKELFIVTNKNKFDSLNWYKIIQQKLENVNLKRCK